MGTHSAITVHCPKTKLRGDIQVTAGPHIGNHRHLLFPVSPHKVTRSLRLGCSSVRIVQSVMVVIVSVNCNYCPF